jgi:predicted PurR-regulated permease PerM
MNFSQYFNKAKHLVKTLRAEATRLRTEKHQLISLEKKEHKQKTIKVDVSTSSIAKATLAILGIVALAYFLFYIKSIIVMFAIAAFLAMAFDPFVDRLQRWRIPRPIGILLIYIIFIGLIGLVIASFIPILATEIPKLATSVLDWVSANFDLDTSEFQNRIRELQNYLANIQKNLNRENIAAGLSFLSAVGQNALAIIKSIAGGVFSFFMILVITFFMVVEEDGIKRFLVALFPQRFRNYLIEKGEAVEAKFGAWVRGQLILMLVIGTLTFLALKIAGVNYAATLGTLAGLTELIPYVGPILAFVPAVILAGSQGGFWLVMVVAAIYIGIQQLEGNVLVPLVMKKAVGLSPIIVMFAMLAGASFPDTVNPIVGIIISVPIATAVSVFVHDYTEKEK